MKRDKRIPPKNRESVENRSRGLCEGCGIRRATDVHHRKYLSRGGGHEIANLIHLCGSENGLPGGNHSGCHGVAHSGEGHELGWSVNSWGDPTHTPVLYRGEMRWITNDGRSVPVGPDPEF